MKKILRNIEIGYKLMASFLLIAVFTTFIGVYAILSLGNLENRTRLIYERGAVPLSLFVSTADEMNKLSLQARNWRLSKTDEGRSTALRILSETHSSLKNLIAKQKELVLAENGKAVLDSLQKAIDKYVLEVQNYTNATTARCPLSGITVIDFSSSILESEIKMIRALENAKETRVHAIKNLSDESSNNYEHDRIYATIVLIVFVILSIVVGSYLTLSITKPLRRFAKEFFKIEKGDMTVRIGLKGNDELGMLAKSIDSLITRLHDIFITLKKDTDVLANSAYGLAGTGKNVANSAKEAMSQSASVANTAEEAAVNMNTIAASIEEMSASISQISSNAGNASKVVSEATNKSREATGFINNLGVAAKEIGHVTNVIKKIADKTNILALNATIEAASAGALGKGFAVVASEIKELANQSSRSADDITKRIEGIQEVTNGTVVAINDVSNIVEQINQSVELISGHVSQQTKVSNEISRNTSEVARGVGVVSQNVMRIAKEASDGANGAKQVNDSADELAKLASNLKDILSQFRV